MLQEKLNGKIKRGTKILRAWTDGPPFCYCFWQLQLLRALPPDPGTIARASCSSELETTHVNHSVQNFFSEGSSEKTVEPRGRRCWVPGARLTAVFSAAGSGEGGVEGRTATGPAGTGPRMPMARPSAAPSMPSRSSWPKRRGRAAQGRRGLSHLNHGGSGTAKDSGVREA